MAKMLFLSFLSVFFFCVIDTSGRQLSLKDPDPYGWRRIHTDESKEKDLLMPTTEYSDADWPIFRGMDRKFPCEVCQSMILVAQTELANRVAERKERKRENYGEYDVALEALFAEELCDLDDRWDYIADRTEVYVVADLMNFCNVLKDEFEFEFIETLMKQKSFELSAKELCVEQLRFCGHSDIWDKADMPENREVKASRNKRIGNDFLVENEKRKGVKTTDTGMQYEVLSEGTEEIGEDVLKVKIVYNATLVNGVSFDDSSKWGEALEIGLKDVVPGMREGVRLSGLGGEVIIALPSDLGYGKEGAGRMVGPDSAILYRLKVTEIVEREQQEVGGSEKKQDEGQEDSDAEDTEKTEQHGSTAEKIESLSPVAEYSDEDDDYYDDELFKGPAVFQHRRDEL